MKNGIDKRKLKTEKMEHKNENKKIYQQKKIYMDLLKTK
jgi:hypothetical protein